MNSQGIQHYSINSILDLRTIQDEYVLLYKELIAQLWINATTIRILAKGYLSISLITPLQLKEILNTVGNTVKKTNPAYELVIRQLHLYFDIKMVTFGIDNNKKLILQFPVFIQLYTEQPLTLYQTVPVSITDQNTEAHPYTHLQIHRLYTALNSETYITIREQELRTCKRMGYGFYCEELFVVKHKSKYSCKSAIYFNLSPEIIKENYKFNFYYNKTDITSTVLDGRNEIILANWPNDKHIIHNINNDIHVKMPSHPYVLINRTVLCYCRIEAENHFLLESLEACNEPNSKLVMYFTMNAAFTYSLDQLINFTESIKYLIIRNKTIFKQTHKMPLNVSKSDSDLLTAPRNLKDLFFSTNTRKKFLMCMKGMILQS